jgi:hypothetical protein
MDWLPFVYPDGLLPVAGQANNKWSAAAYGTYPDCDGNQVSADEVVKKVG